MNTNYKPDYVFEIVCPRKERFVEAKNTYGSFFAFHGSKIENFHSILHNGLINCLNKVMHINLNKNEVNDIYDFYRDICLVKEHT